MSWSMISWNRSGTETYGNIGIVSKRPILCKPFGISIGLVRGFFWVSVSVLVSIQASFESLYQSRYLSRGLRIFCKGLAEFLLSKVSVSVSVPGHFPGISISISLDWDQFQVSVSVSVSIQSLKKYQYRIKISGPVCLCFLVFHPTYWRMK